MLIEQLNETLLEEAVVTNAEWVAGAPSFIQLEVSSVCNLRCTMCPIEVIDAPAKKLKLAEFERILDQFPFLRKIDLYGIGEPLNNPALADIVAAAKARGVHTTVISNGMLLTPKRVERLNRAGLDRLLVSVDSIDPERFNAIRVGGDFHEVIDNLRRVVLAKRAAAGRGPEIGVVTIMLEENRGTMGEVVEYFNRLGIDTLIIKGLNTAYLGDGVPGGESAEALREVEARARRITERGGMETVFWLPEQRGRGKCIWPWKQPFVTAAGDVVPCCNCPDPKRMRLGNLFEEGFQRIWNGPAYRAFRASFRDAAPAVCVGCPDYAFDYLEGPRPALDASPAELTTLAFESPNEPMARGARLSISLRDLGEGTFAEPVDLWLVLRSPSGRFVYLLDRPNNPFESRPLPFRRGIEQHLGTVVVEWAERVTSRMESGEYLLYACCYQRGLAIDPKRPSKGIASNLAKLRFSV